MRFKRPLALLSALVLVFALACSAFAADVSWEEIRSSDLQSRSLLDEACYTAETAAVLKAAYQARQTAAPGTEQALAAYRDYMAALDGLKFVPNRFADVPKDIWYTPAVDFVQASGAMNGTGANRFDPSLLMTRAMAVTVLYRLVSPPEVPAAAPFTDVPRGQWYTAAVDWAYSAGVVKGVTATAFAPDAPVTREQMAALLARLVGVGEPEQATIDALPGYLAQIYSDGAAVSAYAQWPVMANYMSGLMKGDASGTFRPQDTMTRAECAQLMLNVYDAGILPDVQRRYSGTQPDWEDDWEDPELMEYA